MGVPGPEALIADGRLQVQGEAQGDQSALDKLKKDLNEGPPAAHVVKLETKDIATKESESDFTA
jgi:acylphosphatase